MTRYTNEYIADQVTTQVRNDGGFSVFWVTENHRRAFVVSEMLADGRLIREGGQYPWVQCRLAEQKGTP